MCSKTYKTPFYLSKHIRQFHKDFKLIQCAWCAKDFTHQDAYYHHYIHMHEVKDFQCGICGKYFANNRTMTDHLICFHPDEAKPIYCEHCSLPFASERGLTIHIGQMHGKRTVKCLLCNITFPDRMTLYKHKQQIHCVPQTSNKLLTKRYHYSQSRYIARKYKCSHCNTLCHSYIEFEQHVQMHSITSTMSSANVVNGNTVNVNTIVNTVNVPQPVNIVTAQSPVPIIAQFPVPSPVTSTVAIVPSTVPTVNWTDVFKNSLKQKNE